MEAKKAKLDLSPTINDLPNEMLLKIFSFLPQSDHYAVGHVSRRFQDLIDNTKWCVETSVLQITEATIREVREAIENKNTKFSFKAVKIKEVKNLEDLEYILKSIGKEIQYLSMEETAAFHLLKENVRNLKSFEIYFNNVLENSVDVGSFNLQFFPLLEELSFINGQEMDTTSFELLEQLKSRKNTSSFKHLKFVCNEETEAHIIDILLQHASTLESLDLESYYDCDRYINIENWKLPFSRMKKLRKFCKSGYYSSEMINVIFSMLPKENPLEHLELTPMKHVVNNDILTFIVKKWTNSLQYLGLKHFWELTDDAVLELEKLKKLRVLKLSKCDRISKMGLLAGIAVVENIFIDELHLENIWKMDEFGLRMIISRLPNLRVLTLKDLGKAITNTLLQSIWRFSSRLRSLSIECSKITDEGFIGFEKNLYSIKRLRFLVKLTLDNCHSLTDRTLIDGLKLPALQSLKLGYCQKITLEGVESLVKACPLLETLSIPSTSVIDDNALFVIGNGLKHLCQLNITDCINVADNVRDHIRDVFEALQNSTTNATFTTDCKLTLAPFTFFSI